MAELASILDRLLEAEFQFVLIGGFAAVAHGVSLVTQDVDVCGPLDAANLARLEQAIGDLRPRHRMHQPPLELDFAQCRRLHVRNLYLTTDLGPLDVLGEVLGLGGYESVKASSVAVDFHGHPLLVLSLDALITAKSAMGRPRDLEALHQLRALREGTEPPGPSGPGRGSAQSRDD